MDKLLMCEHRNHTPPLAATRFYVLSREQLDPNHIWFWRSMPEFRVYRDCEDCWEENSEHYSDLQISRDDYLAALAMGEL